MAEWGCRLAGVRSLAPALVVLRPRCLHGPFSLVGNRAAFLLRVRLLGGLAALLCLPLGAYAQRQMEKLGRGAVALRTGTTSSYVGWRLLATDAEDVGFNVYRSGNGGPLTKLNNHVLTNTTDLADTTANFSVSNAWFIQPIVNGVAQALGAPAGLPANAPIRQYLSIPLQDPGGGHAPYDVKFCWVGDLDGDGEYDYVVDRLSTTAGVRQFLQAYKRDGTFLWQVDMGFNSTNQYPHEPGASAISVGMGDSVTVYDLDGDGRAEVLLRTANGVVLGNGNVVTAADNVTQFISVLDGLTGAERARAPVPNPYFRDGPLFFHFGIMYCDGVRPSLVGEGWNRVGNSSFNLKVTTWDFRDGVLSQRWTWDRGSGAYSDFHQIRIADVDHDGKDELCQGGYVIDDNGRPLFTTELIHGDRFHIADINPNRPGLETFAIQQDNPTMLGMALYDSATGRMLKKWYQTGVGDVGRGIALDFDARYKGLEMYSTMGGVYDCQGELVTTANPWAPEGLWWDADLLRETIDGAGSGAYSPVVNKLTPAGGTTRLYSIYSEGVHQAYGGRSAFWGDILGDWREELVLVANDSSEIRVYTTKTAATNRLVTLMHNPAYRCQATCKGYYQASYPDFYLGHEMPPPSPAPCSNAKLVWRGAGANTWDTGTTPNWTPNWFWSTNPVPTVFNSGDSVLFDLTGTNTVPVHLVGTLTPGAVTVYAPKDYTFGGSGSLNGSTKLIKAGSGALTVNTTNDFTGATLVAEGPLIVNGELRRSPVTVRGGVWHDGRLAGLGFVGGGVRLEIAGGISPGNGGNMPGTLTVSNGIVFTGGCQSEFDLSATPGGPGDLLQVFGNVTVNGTNDFKIRPLGDPLAPGVYPLITYSGTLYGNLAAQTISGLPGVPVALTNPPGQIALLVKAVRAPSALVWAGGQHGNAWDLLATSNWSSGAARAPFNPGDSVRFDNTGAAHATVNLVGLLNSSSVTVDSTTDYTFGGSGVLMGTGGLAKSNSGLLTINGGAHTFTGPTIIAGGVLSVARLNPAGEPSSVGASGAAATNLVLAGGTLRLSGDDAYTDRNLILGCGTNTLDIPTSGVQLSLVGQLSGDGTLAKTGDGLLLLTSANTYTGGTILKGGRILLGSAAANASGLGSGLVTLEAGTLSMSDVRASETAAWSLAVPAGATARLDVDGRCSLNGALSGGGTLTVFSPYVRTDFSGNWSAFTGQIHVITDGDGGDFRMNHPGGCANASLDLAANVKLYSILSGNPTIDVGALSGASGSAIVPSAKVSGAVPTPFTMRIGGRNSDATFAGRIGFGATVSLVKVGAGKWTLTGTNDFTGTVTVSAGTLEVNGDHSAATGAVVIASGALLTGGGVLGGPTTVQSGGRLSPGAGIGAITFTNSLMLAGSTWMEIRGSPLTNDVLNKTGTLTFGGALVVTNVGGPLLAGNSFKLFNASSFRGSFSSLCLPALPAGLAWSTNLLATEGRLQVVAVTPPRIEQRVLLNGNLVVSGHGGPPGWPYVLLSSSNVALPASQWMRVATNLFQSDQGFTVSTPIDLATTQRFYQILIP